MVKPQYVSFNRAMNNPGMRKPFLRKKLSFADVRFWEKEYKVRDLWKHKDIISKG